MDSAEGKKFIPARELARFLIVGVSNTLATWLVYWLLLRIGVLYLAAYGIGYLVGLANGYLWSKRWVFRAKERDIRYFLKFFAVNLVTLSVNSLLLYILVDKLGFGKLLAQGPVTVMVFCLNYLGNKFWTFRKEETSRPDQFYRG